MHKKISIISNYLYLLSSTFIRSLILTWVNKSEPDFPVGNWLKSWVIAFIKIMILASFLPQLITKSVTSTLFK